MLRTLFVVCPLFLFAGANTSFAQADTSNAPPQKQDQLNLPKSSDPGKQPFIREFFHDEVTMWTSPFRKQSYSSHTFRKYVLPFSLITIALIATDHQTSDLLPNTPDQSKWSLRVSQIGAAYTLAGMSAGMYFIGKGTKNKKARETGFLGAVAIGHAQLLTQGLKYATQRERPLDYKEADHGGTAFFRGGDSFPSGHASSSFALAAVFSYEYGRDHKWVPYTAYGLATVVAASRLSGQKHWMSDLFVGSTMGFLVGRYVYKHHHDPRIDGVNPRLSDRIVPQFGVTPKGLTLRWQL